MRNLAVIGLVGGALMTGLAGLAGAAEEVITARLVIESVPEEVGYAVSSVRSIDLSEMADKALAEPVVGAEITGAAGPAKPEVAAAAPAPAPVPETVPVPEQKLASAAVTAAPVARPDFESSKAVTAAPVKRKVQKVSARAEKKRVTIPVPVVIGAFR